MRKKISTKNEKTHNFKRCKRWLLCVSFVVHIVLCKCDKCVTENICTFDFSSKKLIDNMS